MTERQAAAKKEHWHNLWYIIERNVFLLTNSVIAGVVALLFFFGDHEAALFLGMVLIINITLGLAQDIRAWWALNKLQLLTALRVTRLLADGNEETILTEDIEKDDRLRLKTGDQVPADGLLLEANMLELNEGLITGEATSFARQTGDQVLAGSIITAGTAVLQVKSVFRESRIARMTEGLKHYGASDSPIQREVSRVIKYSGYFLIFTIAYVVVRGIVVNESELTVIRNIGALASALVPQGLVFALTLLFAYGAAHLYRHHVLLQEVNATEKLGRIKNLCMDKTGTLTENVLIIEKMQPHQNFSLAEVKCLLATYTKTSPDTSQTINALRIYTGDMVTNDTVTVCRPFSSWRPYGMMHIERGADSPFLLVLGAPESLLPHLVLDSERREAKSFVQNETSQGKRVLAIARLVADTLPLDLVGSKLSLVALFTLSGRLRPGIESALHFFQNRGVHIRIISGDHPETVRSVAKQAGVRACEQVITGDEMSHWTEKEYDERTKQYTIFARIVPEQKEKIITALKKDGFTAMVGDGANDALAIKKADLGIAMFDGAPATRKLASVVLTNNSFAALPGGVTLADSIIKNAEIFASLFLGSALFTGLLFIAISFLGYPFPLTPLNITLINYFTVGFPGILVSYWTLWPAKEVLAPSTPGFLHKVAPFMMASAILEALTVFILFVLSPTTMKVASSNMWVVFGSVMVGYIFFLFTPGVYRGALSLVQRRDLLILTIVELAFIFFIFRFPLLLHFFEILGSPATILSFGFLGVFLPFSMLQTAIAWHNRHKAATL